ncbi:MAG: hypothetical protein HRU34_20065 [Richelia sp.]|nr:hypothetical protein [Richelia sp.]
MTLKSWKVLLYSPLTIPHRKLSIQNGPTHILTVPDAKNRFAWHLLRLNRRKLIPDTT